MKGQRAEWAWAGRWGQDFSSPLLSRLRGIVVESAAALFHSALQTLGSGYCVARSGKPGRQRQAVRMTHGSVSRILHPVRAA